MIPPAAARNESSFAAYAQNAHHGQVDGHGGVLRARAAGAPSLRPAVTALRRGPTPTRTWTSLPRHSEPDLVFGDAEHVDQRWVRSLQRLPLTDERLVEGRSRFHPAGPGIGTAGRAPPSTAFPEPRGEREHRAGKPEQQHGRRPHHEGQDPCQQHRNHQRHQRERRSRTRRRSRRKHHDLVRGSALRCGVRDHQVAFTVGSEAGGAGGRPQPQPGTAHLQDVTDRERGEGVRHARRRIPACRSCLRGRAPTPPSRTDIDLGVTSGHQRVGQRDRRVLAATDRRPGRRAAGR